MEIGTTRTLDLATRYIWSLIRQKELKPGDRITQAQIAKNLQVSQGVVREVLHKLAEQGIVEITPFKGFRLVSLTKDDLDQIMEIRQLLEPRAIALARKRMTEDDLKDLQKLIIGMNSAFDVNTYDEYHSLFHRRLWEISQNRQLIRILEHLTKSLFGFYQILRTPDDSPPTHKGSTHQILIEALKNEQDLRKVVQEHMREIETWSNG